MDNKSKLDMWLRFEDDFFRDRIIRKMRRLENGADCIIIYQKLMLSSIDDDGLLKYDGLEDTFEEEMAAYLDEDFGTVKETIDFCIKHKLIEKVEKSDSYLLTKVPELLNCDGYCYLGD